MKKPRTITFVQAPGLPPAKVVGQVNKTDQRMALGLAYTALCLLAFVAGYLTGAR